MSWDQLQGRVREAWRGLRWSRADRW